MDAESRGRRRTRRGGAAAAISRDVNYRTLRNPFPPMNFCSDDEARSVHDAALAILSEDGIKVLLPEARKIYAAGGATINDDMVHIGPEMVAEALRTAPRSFPMRAGTPDRDVVMELGALTFQPGAGCPHATDLTRGRRPGTAQDYRELVQITQAFDVLHLIPPLVEAQDVPPALRHYEFMRTQLAYSDKVPFIYSRGPGQVAESFEMLRDFRGLSDAEFAAEPHVYTIINTNSPRQLDVPMARGVIDFARHGQPSVITPFTLMGAMAPITPSGAITLSHAEALAAITLGQLANPGAPMMYGTFTSNVDMKSGAPAFGTPEHFRANLLAGQMARLIGLPWRSATGSAANLGDVQAAHETQFGLWGCLLAGATMVVHSAGWLEGGLTISYEKMITDLEVLQMVAELCTAAPLDTARDAVTEVLPGGHFFAAAHTMSRYQTEFYQPFTWDVSNFGTWTERGAVDTTTRATGIWQEVLTRPGPSVDTDRVAALDAYIAARTKAGGTPPES